MIGQLPKRKHENVQSEEYSEKPGSKAFWWILLAIITGILIVNQHKKENPDQNIPGDEELFEKLPDHFKETFTEKYGRPNEDDRECELYYLLANSAMKRPCMKCPVWCSGPEKNLILVLKNEIYYIGKTCRQEGEREKEHRQMMNTWDLEYQWIKRGTEGYITTAEQLHLKTYFSRPEAVKEDCHLFLPPGNVAGMSRENWRELLEKLK